MARRDLSQRRLFERAHGGILLIYLVCSQSCRILPKLGRLLVRLRLLLATTLSHALILRPLDDSIKERALLRISIHFLWISDDTSAAPLAIGAFIVWVGVRSHVVDSLAVLLVESRGGAALNLELLWRDRIWGFLGLVQHLR